MGGAGVVRSTEHARFQRSLPLGNPRLHDFGWSSLYRAVQQKNAESLCGHRLQQVGDNYLHGSIHDPQRSGAWEGKSRRGGVFTLAYHMQTAAVY